MLVEARPVECSPYLFKLNIKCCYLEQAGAVAQRQLPCPGHIGHAGTSPSRRAAPNAPQRMCDAHRMQLQSWLAGIHQAEQAKSQLLTYL